MRYLLDTNVLSALLREPAGTVATRLATHAESDVFTSVIVACELRYGVRRRDSNALSQRVERLLASLEVVALDPAVDRVYAAVRTELESAGTPIGGNDLLIAAHALERDAVLVTDNEREFSRIRALNVENWLRS